MRKLRKTAKKQGDAFQPQSVVSHLEELRKRIIFSVLAFSFVLFCLVSLPGFNSSFGFKLLEIIREYMLKNITVNGGPLKLVFLDPLEPILTVLKLSSVVSFFVLAPLFFYQIYAYIKPAFERKTGNYLGFLLFGSEILFLLGAVFSIYLLIPVSFNMLIGYGLATGASPILSMGKFIDMFLWMFLLFTLPFELPVLIGILSKIGIVSGKILAKIRKPAYLGLAIFSAAVTPDPSPFSMMLLFMLLIVLFETSVMIAYLYDKEGK